MTETAEYIMGDSKLKEAMLYNKGEKDWVGCFLCSHRCPNIHDGKRGICQVRENRKGILYSLVYGKIIAAHVDPIEKKPFFNYLPGTEAYSIATVGCNFRCRNCQNADISQAPRKGGGIMGSEVQPRSIVNQASAEGCRSIAYTYTEPTIFFEYAYDVSKIARKEGIANLFVTNGYMTGEMLDAYHPLLDAANVDLKSFRNETYKSLCGASLQPVLDSMKKMKQQGVWLEVTTLLIPGITDSKEEIKDIAEYIRTELGSETPWHVSRFHPDYQLLDRPPTAPQVVQEAREIGIKTGLKYVYAGNLPGDQGENTYCPGCKQTVIERAGYRIIKNKIINGRCPVCQTKIDGKWAGENEKNESAPLGK